MNAKIICTMRYRDAPAAIKFLCEAFGFKDHLVVPGAPGEIAHAQLTLGDAMIMLGSVKDDDYGKLISVPAEVGGQITMSPYIILDDATMITHYEQAKKVGAEIVAELKTEEYGGQAYTCKDPEGHVWTFGSYDPYAEV